MWLFYFNFGRNYDALKSKNPCILLNKNINFNKNETELKMENLTVSQRQTLCFSLYENCKLKVKLWWVGACERKRRAFFALFLCPNEIFYYLCFISIYCVFCTFRMYILLHTKTHYFITFLLVFKIVESLQYILDSRPEDRKDMLFYKTMLFSAQPL